MDRAIVQPGQIPLDTDVLRSGQFGMVGNAKTNEALLGTSACVSGFTLTPTSPASLSATLGPGVVFQQANLEATPFGSLPADTHTIVKQGILLDPANVTFTPPTTVGYSQVFLVEVQYADGDTGAVVRPYYNPANPAVQFNGPGGAGTSDNTTRRGAAAYQIKAGIAATSGTQVTPAPDAGWIGLFAVTLAQGATTVTAGNITLYNPSAFIPAPLPAIPQGVQNGQWVFASATGTNTYAANFFSTAAYPFTFTTGMELLVFFPNANTSTTVTLNGKSVVRQGGSSPVVGDVVGFVPLVYDGNNLRINGLTAGDVNALIQTYQTTNYISGGRYAVLTGTGSWTVPANVSIIRVLMNGGGGGGGAAFYSSTAAAGSGGGGGEYAEGVFVVTPSASLAYVQGLGGTGGIVSGAAATAGGMTSLGGIISAFGGGGGSAGNNSITLTGGAPGTGGSGGSRRQPGGSGGLGYVVTSGALGGTGGYSPNGGPQPSPGINGTGKSGLADGGGGSGGSSGSLAGSGNGSGGSNGGPGAAGTIVIQY